FPVLAAFNGTLRQQLTNTLYFSFTRPLHLIPVLFVHIFPLALSYVNLQILPLTAFLWASFGFGAIAMYCSTFHLKAFRPFLGRVDAAGDPVAKGQENDPNLILSEHDESEERTLAEMRKFGL
ncbi:MAG: hypothetical protein IJ088_04400, partial [Clostridia bacterium]|nr:hypothetical protein [Clostridia bacterium]